MYEDELPSGGNRWWRDPFTARRVARWSLVAFAAAGAASALIGGAIGGLLTAAIILALPAMAFFEARGSLFVLHFATSAHSTRRFPPKWWPWFAALAGSIALVFVGGWLAGLIGGTAGDALLAATLATAGGLFFAGLFTLLGYWIDREIGAWIERTGAEEMREHEARARERDAANAKPPRNKPKG